MEMVSKKLCWFMSINMYDSKADMAIQFLLGYNGQHSLSYDVIYSLFQ